MSATGLEFRHVDVFSQGRFSGNGLIVFFGGTGRDAAELLAITQEMRQFESIFVDAGDRPDEVAARIFTVEEELPFAGHPLIGAAAALHERHHADAPAREWTFVVAEREIELGSLRSEGGYYAATMNQGPADLGSRLSDEEVATLAIALSIGPSDLVGPVQVISTGLPYLIVPVSAAALGRAAIADAEFESKLAEVGAKFVYLLDPEAREGRTWDNAGSIEDVATGSAAGPAAAYLCEHGFARSGEPITLRQGRFAGRPSEISVRIADDDSIHVGGPIAAVATGRLDDSPPAT